MNELALFAGAGGGILGGRLLGWTTVGAVEIEEYPREILLQRQRDGMLPEFPVWDDVCTFDGRPWRGVVDVVSGGFPCQDISAAGRGAGIEGERSGLWREMFRIICEVRPKFAFVENSPMLAVRGLGRVLGDLAEAGYNAAWCVLGAADVGAPHRRDRMWVLATRDGEERAAPIPDSDVLPSAEQHESLEGAAEFGGGSEDELESRRDVVDTDCNGGAAVCVLTGGECETLGEASSLEPERAGGYTRPAEWGEVERWWEAEPRLGRVADGVAHRVERLKAIGNGQVPLVAATAFRLLRRELERRGIC